MGERVGGKKKCPLHFTLKRVKVYFLFFIKGTKKRRKRRTKKRRKRRTKRLHFCGQGWEGRHCANAASLA
jgi:hypothetical protein